MPRANTGKLGSDVERKPRTGGLRGRWGLADCFVIGVIADLSGTPKKALPPLQKRPFVTVDEGRFDFFLNGCAPRVVFQVPNTLTGEGNLVVDLEFERMEDFLPDRLARKIEPLRFLLERRERLAGIEVRLAGEKTQEDPSPESLELEFQLLRDDLTTFFPKEKIAVAGCSLLVERARQTIAWLDQRLSDQLNPILHHPDFQALESTWRGLRFMLERKPPGGHLRVKVMNITKEELGAMSVKYSAETGSNGWDQSPLFRRFYSEPIDLPGGDLFGCLVGDYHFDQSASDVMVLERISAVCAAAYAPFIAAAAPGLLGLGSWEALPEVACVSERMTGPEYAAWNALRQRPEACFLALTLPGFLARLPYGKSQNPVEAFRFEEDFRAVGEAGSPTGAPNRDNYVWANAAYVLAANIADAFHTTGWCVAIRGPEGTGEMEGLPVHSFPAKDGKVDTMGPTRVAALGRLDTQVSRMGFLPLLHFDGMDRAFFVGAQTVQKPQTYQTAAASANAELSARLPYVLLVCQFARHLKMMIREWIGTHKDKVELEQTLNEWIAGYTSDPAFGDDVKEMQPLAEARIEVEEVPGQPGLYETRAFLLPHIQLEGIMVHLGVVQRPSGYCF